MLEDTYGVVQRIVYPSRGNRDLRAFILFDRAADQTPPADRQGQMALVASKVAGLPWKIPEILADPARYEDFYFGDLGWVEPRCASDGWHDAHRARRERRRGVG